MTRFSIWAGIRCRRCAWSPRSTPAWMPALRCVPCSRRPRWPGWRPVSVVWVQVGSRGWWRVSGPRWCRCRLPRAGCGFLTSCRGPHRSTTWRWRCGCGGALMPTRWVRRWPMWWAATRACARCSPRPRAQRSRWLSPPSGLISAGRSLMPPAGRRPGWARPSTPRRVTRLIWRLRSLCGQHFSGSPRTSMCWWRWCTISPRTAGRSPRWWVIWGWPMPAGARGKPPAGRRWRCSMSITRCGSARSWVIWPIPIAASPRSWPTGSRPWPGCPSRGLAAAAAAAGCAGGS